MTTIITGESELPVYAEPEAFGWRTYQYFVRSTSAPTLLIDGFSGEVFQRADGRRWKYPGYERHGKRGDVDGVEWGELTHCSAWFDDATYPYTKEQVAA